VGLLARTCFLGFAGKQLLSHLRAKKKKKKKKKWGVEEGG
jgi:hypothetical protein